MRTLPDIVGANATVALGAPAGEGARWVQFVLTGDGTVRIGDLAASSTRGIPIDAPQGFLLPYDAGNYALDLIRIYVPAGVTVSIEYDEAAAPPPPIPVLGNILVLINGADQTDHLSETVPSNWNLMRGSRGTCKLSLIIPPGDRTGPQVGQLVEIFDPSDTRVWAGTIETLAIQWVGDDGYRMITVGGVTLEALYDTATLDKVHYAKAAGAPFRAGDVFADLFTRAAVPLVTLGTVETGPDIVALEVSNVAQGFNTLALDAGFYWYIDPANLKLYFHSPALRPVPFSISAQEILWETIHWGQTRADFRDVQVLQLPGLAQSATTQTFAGDNTTTDFILAVVPEYMIAIDLLPIGTTGKVVTWNPGSRKVTITPAPITGETVSVRYATSGAAVITNTAAAAVGIGSRSALFSTTHAFTSPGGIQEAQAIVDRYSMLPSTMQFDTDKPGIGIARALTIAATHPLGASEVIDGTWLVQEVDANIVPGLDQLAEPYGHFRYTIHLVNTAATAVFQGDNSSTVFHLPEIPSAVLSIRVNDSPSAFVTGWIFATNEISVTPAPPTGSSVAVDYIGANTPDVPTFVDVWSGLGGAQPAIEATPLGQDPPPASTGDAPPPVFQRTLLLKDLAVGDDIADHVPVYHDGVGLRLLGVLRKTIASDLTVRINKKPTGLLTRELVTVTIPHTAVVDEVFEWTLAAGSPAILPPFLDLEVLSADILESDASTDVDGIASFTVEWELI